PRWEPRPLTRPSRGSLCPEVAPWAELGAPAVPPAPSGGKRWRSAPAGRSESTCEEVPAVRQEELPASPVVLAELVEQHEPEVPVTSGPDLPAAAVEAGTAAASAGIAGGAGHAVAGTAEVAGGEDECCCRKQRGQSSSSCPPSPSACAQC